MEMVMNDQMNMSVRICGQVVVPGEIKVPALRDMIGKLACGDRATLVSCRHSDWSDQGRCGCVCGCIGG